MMNELIRKIDMNEGWFGNERDLAKLDAEEHENEVEKLEEKIEELEWSEDDYFSIDKDDLEKIVADTLRKMFWNTDHANYIQPEEEDYDSFVDDYAELLKDELEKPNEKT